MNKKIFVWFIAFCFLAMPVFANQLSFYQNVVAGYHFTGNTTSETGNWNAINVGADLTNDKNAQSNQAYNFVSANSDKMNLTLDQGDFGGSSFSFSFWVNPDVHDATGRYIITNRKNTAGNYQGISLLSYSPTDYKTTFFDNTGTTASNCIILDGDVPIGSWTHMVYTWNSTNNECKAYANGVLKDTDTTGGAYSDSGLSLVLGHDDGTGSPNYWDGQLDELILVNKTLSLTEILEIYNGSAAYDNWQLTAGDDPLNISSLVYPVDNSYLDVLSLSINTTINATNPFRCNLNINGSLNQTSFHNNGSNILLNYTLTFENDEQTQLYYTINCSENVTNTNVITGQRTFNIFKPLIDDCSTYSNKSLNITLRSSDNESLMFGDLDLYLYYKNDYGIYINYSINKTNISNMALCLNNDNTKVYGDFWIEYTISGGNFSYFTYNTTLNNTLQYIYLYYTAGTTPVTFNVKDQDDNNLQNILINIRKFDVATATYTTTEILKTDDEGKAIGNIVLSTDWYSFILSQNGIIVYESQPVIITTTAKEFRVVLTEDYFTRYTDVRGVASSLTFNNATNNFVFTWNDAAGIIHYACLKVLERSIYSDIELNNTCTEATSGTILINIPANNRTYIATSYLKFDQEFILDVLTIVFNALPNYGIMGVFVSFLIVGTLALTGFWSPVAAVIMTLIGFVFMNVLGWYVMSWEWIITLIILGGITIYKVSR